MANSRTASKTAQAAAAKTVIDGDKVRNETTYERITREYNERLAAQCDELGIGSFRRWLIAQSIGIFAGVTTGYALNTLTDFAVNAALLYTGSAFLSVLIWVIGAVLAVYCGVKAYGYGYSYIAEHKIDKHVALVGGWTSYKVDQLRLLFGGKLKTVG